MLSIRTWHGKWFYDAVGKSLWCGTYNSKFCLVEKWRFLVWSLSLPLKNDIQFRFGSWWPIRTRKEQHFEAPLSTKGGTLPSWRSSSCRAPFVHPFMPVPSSSPLIKIRVPQTLVHPWLCGWISFGLQVASFHCTGTLLYTQIYFSSSHYLVTKVLHCHLPVSVESLACRPAWWLNRAVELNSRAGRFKFQLSYSYTAGAIKTLMTFHWFIGILTYNGSWVVYPNQPGFWCDESRTTIWCKDYCSSVLLLKGSN